MSNSDSNGNSVGKGALTLALVAAVAIVIILAAMFLSPKQDEVEQGGAPAAPSGARQPINIEGNAGAVTAAYAIQDASSNVTGYAAEVKVKGYSGDILLEVGFDKEGATITGVKVLESNETEDIGTAVTEEPFLGQFKNARGPFYFAWESGNEGLGGALAAAGELKDGDYTASTAGYDGSGFKDVVQMKVEGGMITSVSWEGVKESGDKKSVLAATGEYKMTEDGPTWDEQAKALAAYVVENQTVDTIRMNDKGKTDSIASVSISVQGFVHLVRECIEQAAGVAPSQPESGATGTQVDAASGASESSKAVVQGINAAVDFMRERAKAS